MQPYHRRNQTNWAFAFQWLRARAGAITLVLAGIGILVWTAYRSPQPSPNEMAMLALLAAVFNVWGGAEFAKIGRADPKHARSAVRRINNIGRNLQLRRRHFTTQS